MSASHTNKVNQSFPPLAIGLPEIHSCNLIYILNILEQLDKLLGFPSKLQSYY